MSYIICVILYAISYYMLLYVLSLCFIVFFKSVEACAKSTPVLSDAVEVASLSK